MPRRRPQREDPNHQAFVQAQRIILGNPMLGALAYDPSGAGLPRLHFSWAEDEPLTRARGWARVHPDGHVTACLHAHGEVDEWVWVLAHCALHLAFGHLDGAPRVDAAYGAACCVAVARFQQSLRLGRCPHLLPEGLPGTDEYALAQRWRDTGVPPEYAACGVGGTGPDIHPGPGCQRVQSHAAAGSGPGAPNGPGWPDRFAIGLAATAAQAVEAAGTIAAGPAAERRNPEWEAARRWFVSAYPLLAGLAAGFQVVADLELAQRWQISIAAVDAALAEIYVNPLARLTADERRFVIAHEMLHAALRHADRVAHRDPYLWNVACDYVINGWLMEMAVGAAPDGVLYDPELTGLSAEAVYDRIATDLRRLRKLATLRGRGLGDVLAEPLPGRDEARRAVDLDEYYRRALSTGLSYHESTGRGLLPAALVEEIRALDQPPLPWDAQLGRWFEEHVPAVERRRTYARPSRRQASTPDIPRPGWYHPQEWAQQHTFGVVLDTSGSMDRTLLGKALGAIASYALARDVPAARVVFCDAAAYDAGYLPVEQIAGRVRVRGRGGTILQPGIRLLERAEDFPVDAPVLIITDAMCDAVRVRREHAFLVPEGARLPFTPRGPVFRLR